MLNMALILQITEAETVEGLFNILVGLGTSAWTDAEYITLRDVLLHLPFADDNGAFGSLVPGTRQQDVRCMAPALQQRG